MRAAYFLWALFGVWALKNLETAFAAFFWIPKLKDLKNPPLTECPKVSVIFSARNEQQKIGAAVQSLLAQDYPHFEVIAVNDRSSDRTGEILKSFSDSRLRIITIDSLPEGWLGKTHGLFQGYRASSGEWLIFTDADVLFGPQALHRAVAAASAGKLDHLTLFPELLNQHYLETMFTSYFTIAFNFRYRPWAAPQKHSLAYVGIGAFNMVARHAYEKAGTHEKVAMDIADDMMLARAVKRAGFRQQAMFGESLVKVSWLEGGLKGILLSLHKNAFRGLEYRYSLLVAATLMIAALDILPFILIGFAKGAWLIFAVMAITITFLCYAAGQKHDRNALKVFPAHPFTAALFLFILWRSALATLRDGGVFWRGTFYRIRELKKFRAW